MIARALLCVLAVLPAAPASAAKLPQLRVVGNKIVDAKKHQVILRGVNAASMEWTSDGEGHILTTVNVAIRDWHANIVRLPMAQDRWFGKAPEQSDEGKAYQALVKQVVDACASQGCYIVLDLHWSDCSEWGKQIGQHIMPDMNSIALWKSVAAAYKNNPAVLFDLYNEPHDTTWDIWLKGGTIVERDRRSGTEKTYETPGMQAMLDAVRSTGAKNVVVCGGLDWAYDLSGVLDGRQLTDTKGNGVIYASHTYPFKGDTPEKWIAKMETASKTLVIVASEFGSESRGSSGDRDRTWVAATLGALMSHGWNWTAWDLHPSAGPRLISDWNYTPTPSFGALVKEALTSNVNGH